jgi:hypothetical protein
MKLMRRVLFAVITLVLLGKLELTSTSAQTNPIVYLEAKDELANYFSASVIRKNVPVTLTANLQHAGYVTRFTRATNDKRMRKKLRGTAVADSTGARILGEKDAFTGTTFKT